MAFETLWPLFNVPVSLETFLGTHFTRKTGFENGFFAHFHCAFYFYSVLSPPARRFFALKNIIFRQQF